MPVGRRRSALTSYLPAINLNAEHMQPKNERYAPIIQVLSVWLPLLAVLAEQPMSAQSGGGAPNAICSGAVVNDLVLDVPIIVAGDNTGAALDPVFGVPVVWEAFTTTSCANVSVGYCGTTPAFTNALITLAVGCPLTNFVFNSSSNIDPEACGDGNFTVLFPDLPAGTYYYPVRQGTGSTGPYSLTFTATACSSSAPANADCSGAITLPAGAECTPVSGNVAFATAAGNNGIGCGNGDVADGVWYVFEATSTSYDLTVAPSAQFNAHVEVFTGGCDALTSVTCAVGADFGVQTVAELTGLTIGETYHVRVCDWYAGSPVTTSFFICLEEVLTIVCEENAGTLSAAASNVCLMNGVAGLTATLNGDAVVPGGYQMIHLLTTSPDGVIVQGALTPSFQVSAPGTYTLHTLVYDGTLDLNGLVFGVTTLSSINGLLVQGGGSICASLDLAGATVVVEECPSCVADAGSLEANMSSICLVDGSATMNATPGGDFVAPTGYEVLYLLTTGEDLVISQGSFTPAFVVTAVGQYTIHTLVYDPNTLDLGGVVFGVTSAFDVASQLIQAGGTICAALDVTGAPVSVEVCTGVTEHREDAFMLWPSPNGGRFMVQGAGPAGPAVLQVIGLDGRRVHEERLNLPSNAPLSVELPQSIARGVYLVRILSEDGQALMRMVLE